MSSVIAAAVAGELHQAPAPRDSDVFAPVILVRKGDENDPTKWIQLSLTQHWTKGDRYFDELIECGALTALDLVVVAAEVGAECIKHVCDGR